MDFSNIENSSMAELQPTADLRLNHQDRCVIDSGGYRLLSGIRFSQCLVDAGRMIGMPYRTAHDKIRNMDEAWGAPVVQSASGGRGGGSAHLTDAGERLFQIYTRLHREHEACLEQLRGHLDSEWNRPLRALKGGNR